MPTHESGAQGSASYQSQDATFFLSNYRLGKTLGVGSFGKVLTLSNRTTRNTTTPPPPALAAPAPPRSVPAWSSPAAPRGCSASAWQRGRCHLAGCRSRWRSTS